MFTVITTPWFAVAIKHHWCRYYWLAEAGLACLQVGPLVIEICY